MKIKILKICIHIVIALTLTYLGITFISGFNSDDTNTKLSYTGIILGLTSILLTAGIRYSDVDRNNKNEEYSPEKDIKEIKDSITDLNNLLKDYQQSETSIIENNMKIIHNEIKKLESKESVVNNSLISICCKCKKKSH